jgi:hypothetical protein
VNCLDHSPTQHAIEPCNSTFVPTHYLLKQHEEHTPTTGLGNILLVDFKSNSSNPADHKESSMEVIVSFFFAVKKEREGGQSSAADVADIYRISKPITLATPMSSRRAIVPCDY